MNTPIKFEYWNGLPYEVTFQLMNTDPQIQEEIKRLERLIERAQNGISILRSSLIKKDPSAVMPAPFDFRIGEFSIRDETLHAEDSGEFTNS